MSQLSDLRAQEKAIQKELDESREHLRNERVRLGPLETQVELLRKELSRIQGDLISALQAELAKKESAA